MVTIPCISYCNKFYKQKKAKRSLEGTRKPTMILLQFVAEDNTNPIVVTYQWDCDLERWYPIHIDDRWVVQANIPEHQFTLQTERIIQVAQSHDFHQNIETCFNKSRHLIIKIYPTEPLYTEFKTWYCLRR